MENSNPDNTPARLHVERESLSSGINPDVLALTQTPDGARALILMILMTDTYGDNPEQANIILESQRHMSYKTIESLWEKITALPAEARISAALLAAPAIKTLSVNEKKAFCDTMRKLATCNEEVSLFEFCIIRAVEGALIPASWGQRSPAEVSVEAELVFNVFLRQNNSPREYWQKQLSDSLQGQEIFRKDLRVLEDSELTVTALDEAFSKLKATSVIARETIMDICSRITTCDGNTSGTELDLLKAFSLAIACPRFGRGRKFTSHAI